MDTSPFCYCTAVLYCTAGSASLELVLSSTPTTEDRDTIPEDRVIGQGDRGIVREDRNTGREDKGIVTEDRGIIQADKITGPEDLATAQEDRDIVS